MLSYRGADPIPPNSTAMFRVVDWQVTTYIVVIFNRQEIYKETQTMPRSNKQTKPVLNVSMKKNNVQTRISKHCKNCSWVCDKNQAQNILIIFHFIQTIKAWHSLLTPYLQDILLNHHPSRQLRYSSAYPFSKQQLPLTSHSQGSVCVTSVWNWLEPDLYSIDSPGSFKSHPKTTLLLTAYSTT